jgi:predicted outer membrane repeat protein
MEEKMKRVLLLWVLLFIALKVNGQEVEVSSFSYLSSLLRSDSPQIISLSTATRSKWFGLKTFFSWFGNDYELLPLPRIVLSEEDGCIVKGVKTIKGNNIILDGEKNYRGFVVAFSETNVNISDLTMERFYNYKRRRGCLGSCCEGCVRRNRRGGAILVLLKGVLNVSGKVNFTSNEAADEGAAIYVKDYSGIKFNDSRVNFTDNRTMSNGGAICCHKKSEILFSRSVVNFTNNRGGHSGRRIGEGGAIYSDQEGKIVFSDSEINFRENRAQGNGGAIFAGAGTTIDCNRCKVNFKYNIGFFSGAIGTWKSRINFINSIINFISNIGFGDGGGAICLDKKDSLTYRDIEDCSQTRLFFSNCEVNFTNNNEEKGGAMYVGERAKVKVNDSKVNFRDNKSKNGGAMYVDERAKVKVNDSKVNFRDNKTSSGLGDSSGGAIYAKSCSISFGNAEISFIGNTAISGNGYNSYGGAIYAINSNIKLNGSTRFIDNQAGREGGAIYMQGGVLDIETDEGKTSEFRGNRANGKSNAIHFRRDALIKFNIGSKGIVNMYDAITSQEEGGVVNINGNGEFNLSSEKKTIIGNLNINDRSKFNVGAGSQLKVRETLRIGQGAMFNKVKGRKKVLKVKEYVQEGTLRMEIEKEEVRKQIKAKGRVILGRNSKMKIEEKGDCSGQAYMLIKYGRLEGRF